MSVKLKFNAKEHKPLQPLVPVPKGEYIAQIIDSEIKETEAGDGQILALTFEVLEPAEYLNRKIFVNLNIQNNSETAEEIAMATLSSICLAVGMDKVNDSSELHEKPMKVQVGIRVDKMGQYPDSNVIRAYESVEGSEDDEPAPAKKETKVPVRKH